MNENFLLSAEPFRREVINGRIYQNECAITDNQGTCLMFGELSTMLSDYQVGKPKWHQPTSAQVYREQN